MITADTGGERSKPEGLLVMSRCFGSDFSQLSSRSEQSAV